MLNFIYRKPGQAYSVENVFDLLFDEMSRTHFAKKTFMRHHRANARSLVRNIARAGWSQSALNHVTGDVNYAILGLSRDNINVVTIHDLVTLDTLHVISNPVSPRFVHTEKSELESKPRILHVGTTPNKNLGRVVAALEGLHVKLVVLGKLGQTDLARLAKARIDFANPCNLSLADVVEEYQKSDMVLFPSLYEGFGLPIVEAHAVGRPVITSCVEPMVEVSADAAVYVNPRDTSEIRSAVLGLIANPGLRRGLVEKGLVNARRFEAGRIAQAYLNVYQSCGYRSGRRGKDG